MINFLFFNGDKIKNGRAPGNALFEPTLARCNQGNYYTDTPAARPVEVGRQPRDRPATWFLTGKYAYYNTGFTLDSIGPLTEQMGISALTRADVWLDQRAVLQRAAAAHRQRRQQPLPDDGATDARLQVRLRLAAHATSSRTDALPWQRRRRVRELGHRTSARGSIARAPARTAPRTRTSTSATRSALGRLTLDLGAPLRSAGRQALAEPDRSRTRLPEPRAGHRASPATTHRSTGTTSRRASG